MHSLAASRYVLHRAAIKSRHQFRSVPIVPSIRLSLVAPFAHRCAGKLAQFTHLGRGAGAPPQGWSFTGGGVAVGWWDNQNVVLVGPRPAKVQPVFFFGWASVGRGPTAVNFQQAAAQPEKKFWLSRGQPLPNQLRPIVIPVGPRPAVVDRGRLRPNQHTVSGWVAAGHGPTYKKKARSG